MKTIVNNANSFLKCVFDRLLLEEFDNKPNQKFRSKIEGSIQHILRDPGHYFSQYNSLNEKQKEFFKEETGRYLKCYLVSHSY